MSDDFETPIVMSFGKHRGEQIEDVPPSYLLWLLEQDWIVKYPDILRYIKENYDEILDDRGYEMADENEEQF